MGQMTQKLCSICKKPQVEKYRPFCSQRCADLDLGGWLGEKYRVPTEESPETLGLIEADSDIE